MPARKEISKEKKIRIGKILSETKTKSEFQKAQTVWLRASLGMTSLDISKAVGISDGRVRVIISTYFKRGETSLINLPRGGRKREHMTLEEENEFINNYIEKSKAGEIIIVNEIKNEYENKIGKTTPKSTIYRILARHGWRKISPRPNHPNANAEAQENFKKNLRKQ